VPFKELTLRQIEAITAPGLHRIAPQLYLSIKPPPGSYRTWALRLTVNGKATWRGLGSCNLVKLDDAKAKAMKMRLAIYNKEFDATPKRKGAAPTFAQVAERYVTDNASKWRWPRAAQAFRSSLALHAAALMKRPVDTITALHVKNAIHKVWIDHPATAKKVRARIEHVLGAARVSDYRTGPNPAIWRGELSYLLPPLSREGEQHHKAMPLDEIPALAARLIELDSRSSKAVLLTLLCAVRSGDTRGAKWSEIDLPNRVWNIPKGRTKAKRPFRVPLSEAAASLLSALPRDGGEYVFPNKRGKPFSDMALLECIRGIKGHGMTVHGLRSSFKDWSREHNYPEEHSELALDHVFGDRTRNAYARSDLFDARKKLLAAWDNFVMSAPSGEATKPPAPEVKSRKVAAFSGVVIPDDLNPFLERNAVQAAPAVTRWADRGKSG